MPKPSQELKHFTNREDQLEILERLLLLPWGRPLPVVCFYGVGGIGKTWLAKGLREVARDVVPTTRLDFDPSSGGARLQDASQILAEIRLQFAQVACPRFDLAYVWLRHKEKGGEAPGLAVNLRLPTPGSWRVSWVRRCGARSPEPMWVTGCSRSSRLPCATVSVIAPFCVGSTPKPGVTIGM